MNAANKLQVLFDIIDRYVASEKGKNEGPFSFLSEEMMTRFITTTPNKRVGVEMLKTYLAKDILMINFGKDYVTYKNILENLEGTAKKRYQVDSRRLEACFDWEKNREAIEKELPGFWVEWEGIRNGIQPDCRIPWLLFGWLRDNVETHLLNFWKLCNVSGEEDVNEKKQEEYMSALYGIALQEIFYRETFSKNYKQCLVRILKIIGEGTEYVEALSSEFSNVECIMDTHTVEEIRLNITQKVESASERLWEMRERLRKETVYRILAAEQNLNLTVEFQLIMLFESLNIYGITGKFLDEWLGKLRQGDLIGFFKDNPNRKKAYCEVDSFVEKRFLSYWNSVPVSEKKDFPWALKTYFEQIEISHRTPEKVDRELMKRARSIIIQAWITTGAKQKEKGSQ